MVVSVKWEFTLRIYLTVCNWHDSQCCTLNLIYYHEVTTLAPVGVPLLRLYRTRRGKGLCI